VNKSFLTHMYCMALKVYTCEEAASGPKTILNIFCKLLQQKEPSPAWQWSWFQYHLTLIPYYHLNFSLMIITTNTYSIVLINQVCLAKYLIIFFISKLFNNNVIFNVLLMMLPVQFTFLWSKCSGSLLRSELCKGLGK
jgi:hypothetical protein